MSITLPAFTPAQESLFTTLGSRALDSRLPHPFLGDTMALDVVEKTGHDLDKMRADQGMIGKIFDLRTMVLDVAIRAKRMDEVVRRFAAAHPDGVVLDLGAGLDSRRLRVDPPPTVDWYDIDFPEIVALRPQVLPKRARGHELGADLTDPRWLDAVPGDRPVVAVADGLVAFLPQDGFVSLLNGLIGHFPSGELAFNLYTPFHVRSAKKYAGAQNIAAGMVNPGFYDPHEPERWVPGLELVEEIYATRAPELPGLSLPMRTWYRLSGLSPWLSRRGTTVVHYAF